MNNKQLKQQRNASIEAMTESELREYAAILRDNSSYLEAAMVDFLNAGNKWALECAENGEASDGTCRVVVKKFDHLIYAFNAGRKLIIRFWEKREAKDDTNR